MPPSGILLEGCPGCLPTEKGALEGLSGGQWSARSYVPWPSVTSRRHGRGWVPAGSPDKPLHAGRLRAGAAGKRGPGLQASRDLRPALRTLLHAHWARKAPPSRGGGTRGAEEGGMGDGGAGWGQWRQPC